MAIVCPSRMDLEPGDNGRMDQATPAIAAQEFPVEHVSLHGERLAYRRSGTGPALLLLHGIAGSSAGIRLRRRVPATRARSAYRRALSYAIAARPVKSSRTASWCDR